MGRRIIIDELDFEVPYGKIYAKTWHEETDDCKRVLLLHGWMDNAGSFDNLAPLLKHDDGLYIVALDMPGHGKSSQMPGGVTYNDMTMLVEIRRCLTELGWVNKDNDSNARKFTLIGHSFGAGLGLFYASLFPNDVEDLILLDFVKPKTVPLEQSLVNLSSNIDQFLVHVPSQSNTIKHRDLNDKEQVVVSQEAAMIATIEAHKLLGNLSREDAACLLKRCTVPVSTPPNSVIFSRDLRLQCMLNIRDEWTSSKVIFNNVKCRILALLANDGLYVKDPQFIDHKDDMIVFLKERAELFNVQWLPGDHYFHLNNTETSANVINKYLKSPKDYEVTAI